MQMIPEDDLGVNNNGYTEMESGLYTINNGYTPVQFTVLQNSTKIQARNSVTSLVIKGNSSVTTINQQNTEADGITFYTTTSNDGRYRAKSRQYRVSITPADDVLPPYTALSIKPPAYEKKVYIEEEDEFIVALTMLILHGVVHNHQNLKKDLVCKNVRVELFTEKRRGAYP
ncbi:uncharacterized protein LOC124806691 isoform X2 [Hydra vulgaris]|uniref:uncharacterized protein LOC124806691 isoform X2 n=1 Tax=Hydra vulgaris TaxID=6087 RepID=UPI001F5EFC28|nr:uncharacterized protein LOC124806691 isoform X2 [Hydra vulgaris]